MRRATEKVPGVTTTEVAEYRAVPVAHASLAFHSGAHWIHTHTDTPTHSGRTQVYVVTHTYR